SSLASGKMNQLLENYIIAATVVFALMVWFTWRGRTMTVGLPLCYLLSLGMIHYVGGIIYLLPWHDSLFAGFVVLGFREYFIGMAAFTVGVVLIELFERRRQVTAEKRASRTKAEADLEKATGNTRKRRFQPSFMRYRRREEPEKLMDPVRGGKYLPMTY